MLHWYDVNSTLPSVTVGFGCNQFAFDGEHMWVTVWGTGKVVKIRASDMAVIGSYDVVPNPNPIIFDGDEIWVGSGASSGQITRLRASDGSLVSTLSPMASSHWGMAFDGANVWVTNTRHRQCDQDSRHRRCDPQYVRRGRWPDRDRL